MTCSANLIPNFLMNYSRLYHPLLCVNSCKYYSVLSNWSPFLSSPGFAATWQLYLCSYFISSIHFSFIANTQQYINRLQQKACHPPFRSQWTELVFWQISVLERNPDVCVLLLFVFFSLVSFQELVLVVIRAAFQVLQAMFAALITKTFHICLAISISSSSHIGLRADWLLHYLVVQIGVSQKHILHLFLSSLNVSFLFLNLLFRHVLYRNSWQFFLCILLMAWVNISRFKYFLVLGTFKSF